MTLATAYRMFRAAIRAARKEGAAVVEVKIGDATVHISLTPAASVSNMTELVG